MNKDYYRLKEAVAIDSMRLSEELMEVSGLLLEASEYTTKSIQDRDLRDLNLDIIKSETANRVRTAAEKKPTEAAIQDSVQIDPAVIDAQVKLLDAKTEASLWMGLVEGFRTKASSLKRICEMTTAGYLAPSAAYENRKAEINKVRRNRFGPISEGKTVEE